MSSSSSGCKGPSCFSQAEVSLHDLYSGDMKHLPLMVLKRTKVLQRSPTILCWCSPVAVSQPPALMAFLTSGRRHHKRGSNHPVYKLIPLLISSIPEGGLRQFFQSITSIQTSPENSSRLAILSNGLCKLPVGHLVSRLGSLPSSTLWPGILAADQPLWFSPVFPEDAGSSSHLAPIQVSAGSTLYPAPAAAPAL